MRKYKVERERWVSTENPTNSGIMRGYDETYYDEVEANYFVIKDNGTALFYQKELTSKGVEYELTVAYAPGEWKTVKEE